MRCWSSSTQILTSEDWFASKSDEGVGRDEDISDRL